MSSDAEFMAPAFCVDESDDEEFDLNLPPATGNEYLRRVRLEALQCPDVVVADIDSSQFSRNRTQSVLESNGCQPAPKGFAPTMAWQHQQVADFADVRLALAAYKAQCGNTKKRQPSINLPKIEDDVGWCKLCFGNELQRKLAEKNQNFRAQVNANSKTQAVEEPNGTDGLSPYVSVVASLTQPMVEQVLDYHLGWMEATGFTKEQGRWFYSLLAALEKPLTPDACSSIRTLARYCANLRATLESDDYRLAHLNLLICLVARYFDQHDLADNEV